MQLTQTRPDKYVSTGAMSLENEGLPESTGALIQDSDWQSELKVFPLCPMS